MKFGSRGDVRGFLAQVSNSIRFRKSSSAESTSKSTEEEEVEAVADSFIGDEDLRDFVPRGKAGMEIRGAQSGAIDMDFTWDEDSKEYEVSNDSGTEGASSAEWIMRESNSHQPPSGANPGLQRMGGRSGTHEGDPVLAEGYVRPEVPKLSIVILICGTRGDVQPFVVLALKLKEYGHRVRIATHKDYRKFVTGYDLEFYPLGGDPKILSDFIVKHRGVFTIDTKDAIENLKQVEEIVFSSYDACTKPDPEGDGRLFRAQAIIANPPSYGHIHCAEKLQVPLHIYFTMPWTPTRNFPHPLARIKNVRDTRPSSIALRNYLSYIIVNEYTYTGLSSIFNRFRKEVLGLQPLRLGNSGSTLLDTHNVPFTYCWSPSLVPKPGDWDDHVAVTGYFFLHEGTRSTYQPPPALRDFLAAGPPPVYIGFGSLMVDDHKKVTQKILDAFSETGQRLLLSKGWAGLGEGFDLPESVMLLDDVPHDWLLPKCSAVVHHGGAGTTAAGLLAACPTLVIPFFGDQTFWGSAVYRRGVGPRPIPIDALTTKKLIAALKFMEDPQVKAEAVKISEQIKQEDGATAGLEEFHRLLPVESLVVRQPTEWHLAKPSIAGFFSELGGGIADLFVDPVRGARDQGVKGALKGLGKGVSSVVLRPLRGAGIAGSSMWEIVSETSFRTPKCLKSEGSVSSKEEAAAPGIEARGSPSFVSDKNAGETEDEAEETAPSQEKSIPEKQPGYLRTFSFRMIPQTNVADTKNGTVDQAGEPETLNSAG